MPTFNLLSTNNPKTLKGAALGYDTYILHLAPARISGYNACPMASKGCAAACLNTAGRGGMFKAGSDTNIVQRARIRKTRMFFENRDLFMSLLVTDIYKAIEFSRKRQCIPVFRLNGTSDIRWETVPVGQFANVMAMFPNVRFYDYTKIPNRRDLPANYHLTFSLNEANHDTARALFKAGMNVAVVFRGEIPRRWKGARVFVGDTSDLRFLDPAHRVVGLTAKGKAIKDTSGFVQG